MKVTEQIDAMEVSAVNPYKYLAATRVLACITMLPLLTLAADFCGVIMGWVSVTLAEPVSFRYFLESGLKNVQFQDFIPPTTSPARQDVLQRHRIGYRARLRGSHRLERE